MKEKIFNYIRNRKLLVILLGIYVVLSVISLVYIHYNGEKLVTADSPIAKITQKLGLGDPVAPPSSPTKKSTNGNGTSGGADDSVSSEPAPSDGSDGGQSGDGGNGGDDSNDLTAVVAFYADTQQDTDEEDTNHSRVADYLLGSAASSIFHAGDIMEDGTQASMDRFAAVTESLRAAKSFYPAFGNNDRAGGSPSPILLDFFGKPTRYSVNIGNLHLVVLDSAFESMAPGSAQYNWLASDLQSEAAKSRIVGIVFHHPSAASNISALLSENHVDFVVQGHLHSYSQSTSGGVYYFVCSGQPSIGYLLAYVYENNVVIKAYNSGNGVIGTYNIDNR